MATFEDIYNRICRYPIVLFEVGEFCLMGPKKIYKAVEKVRIIRDHLKTTQRRKNPYANNRLRNLEFMVGYMVCLNISRIKMVIRLGKKGKLITLYLGTYEAVNCKGKVNYDLKLPIQLSQAHPVFVVSIQKKCIGDPVSTFPPEVL